MDLLSARSLSAGYRGRAVVDGVSLSVEAGRILTLIGPNGAGKSTLLKTITRQLTPLAGTVLLDGRNLSALPPREAARSLAILMTDRPSPELMTCREVAAAGRYPYTGRLGILSREDQEEVQKALDLVGAGALADREFSSLSDGQRQLVLFARAICQKPRVLVLDEPTSFLDVRHKLLLLSILKTLVRQENIAVVLSLHELDLAQKISDTILCVKDGHPDRMGTPEEIFSGGYLRSLYGVERGTCLEAFGSLELEAPAGEPLVFVIGGNGRGMDTFRRLQRQGIPFAVGVLHENDVDLPVARALAVRVITEDAFEPIRPETIREAESVLLRCQRVICCLPSFGTLNAGNARLLDLARDRGIPVEDCYGL